MKYVIFYPPPSIPPSRGGKQGSSPFDGDLYTHLTQWVFWRDLSNCLKILNIEYRTRNRRMSKVTLRHSIFDIGYSAVQEKLIK